LKNISDEHKLQKLKEQNDDKPDDFKKVDDVTLGVIRICEWISRRSLKFEKLINNDVENSSYDNDKIFYEELELNFTTFYTQYQENL